jgi:hypothetical protein
MTEEEVQKQTTISVIMTEPKNCTEFVEGGTSSCTKTDVTCDVDGTEELSAFSTVCELFFPTALMET